MSTGNKFNRGDVVLLPISFVSGVTVDQRDIVRKIGHFSAPLLTQLELCIKAALRIP